MSGGATLAGAADPNAGAGADATAPARGDGSAHQALLALGRLLSSSCYRHTALSPASHQNVLRRGAAGGRRGGAGEAAAGPAAEAAAGPAAGPAAGVAADTGAGLADIFGLSRKFSADQLDPAIWGAMNQAGIVRADGAGWRSALRAATVGMAAAGAAGEPLLFFHSAYPTLDDDAVFFDPDTYRFLRALRAALAAGPLRRAVDIGCGAGAGAVCIGRAWPHAEVLAVDLNVKALALATVNAALAGAHRVRAVHSDVLAGVDGDFDLIVAHPPYLLDPCGRPLRHGGGVHGEQRSFDIVSAALRRLAPGGRLLLYTGVAMVGGADPLLARLQPLLDGAGLAWHYEEIDPDIHGDELAEAGYEQADRIAAVWLEARRPG